MPLCFECLFKALCTCMHTMYEMLVFYLPLSGFILETGMAPLKESLQFGDTASVNSEGDLVHKKHQKGHPYWMLPLLSTCFPRWKSTTTIMQLLMTFFLVSWRNFFKFFFYFCISFWEIPLESTFWLKDHTTQFTVELQNIWKEM